MGSFSLWHWLIVLAVVVLIFGTRKLPNAMGDLAKGFKAFKKGLNEDAPAVDKAEDVPPPPAAAKKEELPKQS